jgi:hypothetical protein
MDSTREAAPAVAVMTPAACPVRAVCEKLQHQVQQLHRCADFHWPLLIGDTAATLSPTVALRSACFARARPDRSSLADSGSCKDIERVLKQDFITSTKLTPTLKPAFDAVRCAVRRNPGSPSSSRFFQA